MNQIIIIGGSQSHIPFIETAKKLGFYTIVFDIDETCEGAKISDRFIKMSTHDIDQITAKCCEINDENNLKCVMTYSSSIEPLYAVAKTCNVLGLPSFSLKSVELATNKMLMKDCFVNSGVPTPDWIITDKIYEAIDFMNESNNQLIMKPSTGSQGSKGVAMINQESDISCNFEISKENSYDSKVLIEEYYTGREFSVDGIVVAESPVILSVSKKFNRGPEFNFTMCGFSMGKIADNDRESQMVITSIREAALKAAVAMEISDSFFSVDILITDDGPLVLECGILLDCKIDRLLRFAGVNVYKMLLKVIIREDTTIEEPDYSNGYGLAFMFAEQSGNLILNTKNRLDNSAIVEWERSHGDSISPPKSIADTLGWVIVRDKDSHEAYNHARETACSGLFQVQR